VQMMLNFLSGSFNGIRFLDINGTPILTCGRMIEDPNCLSSPYCLIKEFILLDNQRIVGFRSVSDSYRRASHQDLQFVLMAPLSKTVMLKLWANTP
jgi:hypothetical protein